MLKKLKISKKENNDANLSLSLFNSIFDILVYLNLISLISLIF
jgi:hypothetical protein